LYIDQIQDLAVSVSFVQTTKTAFHVKLPKFNWSCQHNDTQMIYGYDFSMIFKILYHVNSIWWKKVMYSMEHAD